MLELREPLPKVDSDYLARAIKELIEMRKIMQELEAKLGASHD